MGKTRDLFKKIRDTKGTFHAKMDTIKDRNGMDLTQAEEIKKRWQEYTRRTIQKTSSWPRQPRWCDYSPRARHPGMQSEVSLKKHHWTKLVEVTEFQLSYLKSSKMMLWKCCTQYASKFGKLSSGHRTGKCQCSFQSQRKAMPQNVQTTAQLHTSKVMLKILQARLWKYVNHELPDVQAGFRKGRGTRDQIGNICCIIDKAESFRKTSTSALLTMPMPLTVWITTNSGRFLKRWEYQTTLPASWEICMQVKRQQNWTWNNRLVPNWERLYIITMLI